MSQTTHFWSQDERFCGSKELGRKFTFDDNEVTCQACRDRDTLTLTPQGYATVAALEAKEDTPCPA